VRAPGFGRPRGVRSSGPGAVLAIGLVVGLAASSLAAVVHVDATAPDGGDGSAERPFAGLPEALEEVGPGDCIQMACGIYQDVVQLVVDGKPRGALLPLPAGVTVRGAGAGCTVLRAEPSDLATYGITAEGVGPEAQVLDLTVEGACFQGVNLRAASPTLTRVVVRNDVTGGSSVALDARDGSFPQALDCAFDGGHNALFVEFASGGTFSRCRLGRRPLDTLVVIGSSPTLRDCTLEGGGRDTIVLSADAQPRLQRCTVGEGERWTVRVVLYASGSTVDASGNRWFTRDPDVLAEAILDARDDPGLGAVVEFLPFADPVAAPVSSVGGLKARYAP
jgi:hypothetical protein